MFLPLRIVFTQQWVLEDISNNFQSNWKMSAWYFRMITGARRRRIRIRNTPKFFNLIGNRTCIRSGCRSFKHHVLDKMTDAPLLCMLMIASHIDKHLNSSRRSIFRLIQQRHSVFQHPFHTNTNIFMLYKRLLLTKMKLKPDVSILIADESPISNITYLAG